MTVESNPFLELAEAQISAPAKRAAEKRTARQAAADKRLDERSAQAKAWRAWRRQRIQVLLDGPHGEAAAEFSKFLETMTLDDGPALIALVERGPWRDADLDVRFEILAMTDQAITRLRERHALPPFDDALGDEPLTVFQEIRRLLGSD